MSVRQGGEMMMCSFLCPVYLLLIMGPCVVEKYSTIQIPSEYHRFFWTILSWSIQIPYTHGTLTLTDCKTWLPLLMWSGWNTWNANSVWIIIRLLVFWTIALFSGVVKIESVAIPSRPQQKAPINVYSQALLRSMSMSMSVCPCHKGVDRGAYFFTTSTTFCPTAARKTIMYGRPWKVCNIN